MAKAPVPVKQLDDITECPICTEVYTDPRVLPCIHTYCLKCIETWSKDKHPGDEVACPLCRKEFTLPSNGPRDLPKNFFVAKLLQIKELSQAESRSTPCDVCSHDRETDDAVTVNSAAMFCPDCQEKLCETCAECHRKMRATRQHKLVVLGEQGKIEAVYIKLKTAFCDKHPEDSLRIYCFACKLVVCMMCYVEDHNSHKCSDVSKVAEEFHSQMTSDVDKLNSCVEKSQEMLQNLVKDKDAFIGQINKAEKEICEKAEGLKETIDRHKQKLLEELTTIRQKRMKEMDNTSEEIERQLLIRESFKKYVNEVMNKGTACDIVRAAGGLHDRADELLKFDVIERSLADLGHVDVTFTLSNVVFDEVTETLGTIAATESRPTVMSNPVAVTTSPGEAGTWTPFTAESRKTGSLVVSIPPRSSSVRTLDTLTAAASATGATVMPSAMGFPAVAMSAMPKRPGLKYYPAMRSAPQPVGGPLIPQVPTQALHVQDQEPLTASLLAEAPPQEQKQMLGERLFPMIYSMYPEMAGRITGMLLEIDNSELLYMLESFVSLKTRVEEAAALLYAHQQKEAATIGKVE